VNGGEIIEDIYRRLDDFRARGLEPPEAIGLTKREVQLICEYAGQDFDESQPMMPMTIWGQPIIMVKG
jgi:hypothetical protein